MKRNHEILIANVVLFVLFSSCLRSPKSDVSQSKETTIGTESPNLLIIHTDEHNFRTLGAYRNTMSTQQAFMWGQNVMVSTPNIDALAREGALCTNYYAASPVCTPSRASFVSGLYPIATGSPRNDIPLNDGLITFAEMLRQRGYATAYIGKWHLDGDAKPGFAPTRKFGFDDNRYMFNRGHWKMFEETSSGPSIIGNYNPKNNRYRFDINLATEQSFATDFLVDRTLEIIDRDKSKPFCVMLSLPDPHGPNRVRAPYDSMYSHLQFEKPRTMDIGHQAAPKWNVKGRNSATEVNHGAMAQYFGMVKCIDDNVGKIMRYLKANKLDRNTIIVFTSDHGDLMGEHGKHNKGLPYETSAGIPFIIRYPGKIPAGKRIHTAYTTVDFAPTILSLMGIKGDLPNFHGLDASNHFTGSEKEVQHDRIVYITNANSRWVAAVDSHYKLVLSPDDKPWLFDLQKDPDELVNFYDDPDYQEIASKFKQELIAQMTKYQEPALKNGDLIYD